MFMDSACFEQFFFSDLVFLSLFWQPVQLAWLFPGTQVPKTFSLGRLGTKEYECESKWCVLYFLLSPYVRLRQAAELHWVRR